MIIQIKQVIQDINFSEFMILQSEEKIGEILINGQMMRPKPDAKGNIKDKKINMCCASQYYVKGFQIIPYDIAVNDKAIGTISSGIGKTGFFSTYNFYKMEGEVNSISYLLGFGKDGFKVPIYNGKEQISLIEKDNVVRDGLHEYKVYSVKESDMIYAVIICMYYYIDRSYQAGIKIEKSVVKSAEITTNKFANGKYNSEFVNRISEY